MKNTDKTIFEGYPKRMICSDYKDFGKSYEAIVTCEAPNSIYPFKSVNELGEQSMYKYAKDIPIENRTIEDGLVEGDIIILKNKEREVLGVCGKLVFTTYESTSYAVNTLKLLIENGWELKSKNKCKIIEISLEDAEKELTKIKNNKVKIIENEFNS